MMTTDIPMTPPMTHRTAAKTDRSSKETKPQKLSAKKTNQIVEMYRPSVCPQLPKDVRLGKSALLRTPVRVVSTGTYGGATDLRTRSFSLEHERRRFFDT
eukprot:scaffold56562_cov53-Attheya_sp.AAC.3